MEGFIFGGAYLRRETLRFKIDWASLIVGSKFIVFALFYFVPEGNFPSTNPWGAYVWRGYLMVASLGLPRHKLFNEIFLFFFLVFFFLYVIVAKQ